jgi:hypothetical protein
MKTNKIKMLFDIMDTPQDEKVREIIKRAYAANCEIETKRLEYQLLAAKKENARPYCLELQRKKRIFAKR